MAVNGYEFTALTGGGAGALDSKDGADLIDGDIAMVTVSGSLYWFRLDDDSGASESSPQVIAPDANAGTKRWILQTQPVSNTIPVGCILPFIGGYFANGTNGGFVNVIGNDASTINALVSSGGFRVCDGSALNLGGSSIYNGTGRYLPNLTDSRFLMGSTAAGATGGSSSVSHQHNYDHAHYTGDCTLTINQIPSHQHTLSDWYTSGSGALRYYMDTGYRANQSLSGAQGGGQAHNHGATVTVSGTYGSALTAAATLENRPPFLSCWFIKKVI